MNAPIDPMPNPCLLYCMMACLAATMSFDEPKRELKFGSDLHVFAATLTQQNPALYPCDRLQLVRKFLKN